MKICRLESIEPKSNPFLKDQFHMGVGVNSDIMIMHSSERDGRTQYLIVVDMNTGERIQIDWGGANNLARAVINQAEEGNVMETLYEDGSGPVAGEPFTTSLTVVKHFSDENIRFVHAGGIRIATMVSVADGGGQVRVTLPSHDPSDHFYARTFEEGVAEIKRLLSPLKLT